MHGPASIVWATLTRFSLQAANQPVGSTLVFRCLPGFGAGAGTDCRRPGLLYYG